MSKKKAVKILSRANKFAIYQKKNEETSIKSGYCAKKYKIKSNDCKVQLVDKTSRSIECEWSTTLEIEIRGDRIVIIENRKNNVNDEESSANIKVDLLCACKMEASMSFETNHHNNFVNER